MMTMAGSAVDSKLDRFTLTAVEAFALLMRGSQTAHSATPCKIRIAAARPFTRTGNGLFASRRIECFSAGPLAQLVRAEDS